MLSIISFSSMLLILLWPLLFFDGNSITMHLISNMSVGWRNMLALFDCKHFRYSLIDLLGLGILLANFFPTCAKYLAKLLLICFAPYSLMLSIQRYSIRVDLSLFLPDISLIKPQSFLVWDLNTTHIS